jgi:hypothetical protein
MDFVKPPLLSNAPGKLRFGKNSETFYLNEAKDLRGFGVFNGELAEGHNAFTTISARGNKTPEVCPAIFAKDGIPIQNLT